MAKSLRCKREKRLRAIRREIVEPFYEKKDAAKLAAQEAALAAPKLPVRPTPDTSAAAMETASTVAASPFVAMDVEMVESNQNKGHLKPHGGIGKKLKKKFKMGKGKRRGKGRIRGKHNI
ncbi:uncharacterized protein LOC131160151 [Malania oleifera]|uniref:uncharacterized protein LOC131160151 n=1 Tax=Malania oleifera TaxID=397392 RepID=UPI0025AE7ED0|nr:uncharacterized protein LOC131160151 [Malania oleifera]